MRVKNYAMQLRRAPIVKRTRELLTGKELSWKDTFTKEDAEKRRCTERKCVRDTTVKDALQILSTSPSKGLMRNATTFCAEPR